MRKAKYRDIKIWYKFKPRLNGWIERAEGKSFVTAQYCETWYNGLWFKSGYFAFIQCKVFSVHISLSWWADKSINKELNKQ